MLPGFEVHHLHPPTRLRMSGVLPLLPIYAFMARTGATLDVAFCSFIGGLLTITDSVSNCTALGRTGTHVEESYCVLH